MSDCQRTLTPDPPPADPLTRPDCSRDSLPRLADRARVAADDVCYLMAAALPARPAAQRVRQRLARVLGELEAIGRDLDPDSAVSEEPPCAPGAALPTDDASVIDKDALLPLITDWYGTIVSYSDAAGLVAVEVAHGTLLRALGLARYRPAHAKTPQTGGQSR